MAKIILCFIILIYLNNALSLFVDNQISIQNYTKIIEKNIEALADKNNENINVQIERENVGQTLRYTIGRRSSADNLIGQRSDSHRYPFLQNVKLTLNYPAPGNIGKTVSFCEIIVDQSSNIGRGYIISGGIGQRRIAIAIEANSTMFITYRAYLYGY